MNGKKILVNVNSPPPPPNPMTEYEYEDIKKYVYIIPLMYTYFVMILPIVQIAFLTLECLILGVAPIVFFMLKLGAWV